MLSPQRPLLANRSRRQRTPIKSANLESGLFPIYYLKQDIGTSCHTLA